MGDINQGENRRQDLVEQIQKAIEKLCEEDILLRQNVNERTIAHRFALHLEDVFKETGLLDKYPHVDVEYNRIGDKDRPVSKRFDDGVERLLCQIEKIIKRDHHDDPEARVDDILDKLQNRLIYPDIIVHERGESQNHLVIELKKGTNSNLTDEDEFDHAKLTTYTDEENTGLNYSYGLFLKLRVGDEAIQPEEAVLYSAQFENGEKVEENMLF